MFLSTHPYYGILLNHRYVLIYAQIDVTLQNNTLQPSYCTVELVAVADSELYDHVFIW